MSVFYYKEIDRWEWKYELIGDYSYPVLGGLPPYEGRWFVFSRGGLTVKEGYSWDGATGAIDTLDLCRASMVHDVICQAVGAGILPWCYRKIGDGLFLEILKADGVFCLRRWWCYAAVRTYSICKRITLR